MSKAHLFGNGVNICGYKSGVGRIELWNVYNGNYRWMHGIVDIQWGLYQ